jgi:hypothetical protein
MVKIEFFRDGKSLGSFPLKKNSNDIDRDEVAEVNQIGVYDRFKLDDGRIDCWKPVCDTYYVDSKGQIWLVNNS